MKRLLIYFLLLANICSGFAVAWDNHPEAVAGHDVVNNGLLVDGNNGHSNGAHDQDSSYCHVASHMMGIFDSASMQVATVGCDHFYSFAFALPSLYISPLLRPPII